MQFRKGNRTKKINYTCLAEKLSATLIIPTEIARSKNK